VNARPRVFVTVGTDHHPFDRMAAWIEPWLARRPDVGCVAQHGSSRPPAGAEAHPLLPHEEMARLMAEARVVVCHGGPGTITAARDAGRLPIVVPRQAALGEHVDDHQVRFARLMAERGLIALPESPGALAGLLDLALAEPDRFAVPPQDGAARAAETAARFGELVAELMARRGPRQRRRTGLT